MDLGECPKIHDLALRADFEKASQAKDYYYDIDVSIHIVLMFFFCKLFNVMPTVSKHYISLKCLPVNLFCVLLYML
jgi:hypothetical protein